MSKYEYLKPYVNPVDTEAGENSFYSVSKEKISESGKTLNRVFPESLKTFWREIGYGFFGATSPEIGLTQIDYSNRLLPPEDIVSILTEGVESGLITDQGFEFLNDGDMPIFEIADFTSYLVMKPNSDYPDAVYRTNGKMIEDSLETFIWKLYHVSPTYYLDKL
jgi:antitoxin YxxD